MKPSKYNRDAPQFPASLIKNRNSAVLEVTHLSAARPYLGKGKSLAAAESSRKLREAGVHSYMPFEGGRLHCRGSYGQIYKWLLDKKR